MFHLSICKDDQIVERKGQQVNKKRKRSSSSASEEFGRTSPTESLSDKSSNGDNLFEVEYEKQTTTLAKSQCVKQSKVAEDAAIQELR